MKEVAHEGIANAGGAASDQVQHTGGQTGLGQGLDEPDGTQWGERGRFENDGIAEGEGRGDFPNRDGDWEVPGGDRGNDAERFANGVQQGVRVHRRVMFAGGLLSLAGVVAQDLGGPVGFADTLLEGFAFLAGELATDVVGAGGDEIGRFGEDVGAGDGGGAAPGVERGGGGGNRGVDIVLAAGGKVADQVVDIRGAAVFEGVAGGGGSPFASDVIAEGGGGRSGRGHAGFLLR